MKCEIQVLKTRWFQVGQTVDEQEIRVLQTVITTLMQQLVQQPLSVDARTTALLALNDFRNLFHH